MVHLAGSIGGFIYRHLYLNLYNVLRMLHSIQSSQHIVEDESPYSIVYKVLLLFTFGCSTNIRILLLTSFSWLNKDFLWTYCVIIVQIKVSGCTLLTIGEFPAYQNETTDILYINSYCPI